MFPFCLKLWRLIIFISLLNWIKLRDKKRKGSRSRQETEKVNFEMINDSPDYNAKKNT